MQKLKDQFQKQWEKVQEKTKEERKNFDSYSQKLQQEKEKYQKQFKEEMNQEKRKIQQNLKEQSVEEFEKKWQKYRDEKAKFAEEQLKLRLNMMEAQAKLEKAGNFVKQNSSKVKEQLDKGYDIINDKMREKFGENYRDKFFKDKNGPEIQKDYAQKYGNYTEFQSKPVYGQSYWIQAKNSFNEISKKIRDSNMRLDLNKLHFNNFGLKPYFRKFKGGLLVVGMGILSYNLINVAYQKEIKYQDEMKRQQKMINQGENQEKSKEELLQELYMLEQQKMKLLSKSDKKFNE
ncbi:hypothetical protein PPERSA_12734 [Pseudocohnilembus persalinus]|uniref:Uncharacterized protein n=1 Tax=Pseudocohnilembus persalinus TaxID=266149 RepID=A0A0V0QTJ0_PSEPJ|nr:hypothetical protein PPERSA_12734 [Pseudocohnilembus persalinus]|eukprot:KRX05556.1 hypothetical protein PPERSA_12734 [Pseudocohnilembus persalinus]